MDLYSMQAVEPCIPGLKTQGFLAHFL